MLVFDVDGVNLFSHDVFRSSRTRRRFRSKFWTSVRITSVCRRRVKALPSRFDASPPGWCAEDRCHSNTTNYSNSAVKTTNRDSPLLLLAGLFWISLEKETQNKYVYKLWTFFFFFNSAICYQASEQNRANISRRDVTELTALWLITAKVLCRFKVWKESCLKCIPAGCC